MTIKFFPRELASKLFPEKKIERLITKKLTINKAALSALSDTDFMSKKTLNRVTLNVLKKYKQNYRLGIKEGLSKADSLAEAINEKRLLVQRIQNEAVHEITSEVHDKYEGQRYKWLPSGAEHPDELHQLNYGEIFIMGEQEDPGERYGCDCGMEILVKESRLEL